MHRVSYVSQCGGEWSSSFPGNCDNSSEHIAATETEACCAFMAMVPVPFRDADSVCAGHNESRHSKRSPIDVGNAIVQCICKLGIRPNDFYSAGVSTALDICLYDLGMWWG
jgi:hypothetical protein